MSFYLDDAGIICQHSMPAYSFTKGLGGKASSGTLLPHPSWPLFLLDFLAIVWFCFNSTIYDDVYECASLLNSLVCERTLSTRHSGSMDAKGLCVLPDLDQ